MTEKSSPPGPKLNDQSKGGTKPPPPPHNQEYITVESGEDEESEDPAEELEQTHTIPFHEQDWEQEGPWDWDRLNSLPPDMLPPENFWPSPADLQTHPPNTQEPPLKQDWQGWMPYMTSQGALNRKSIAAKTQTPPPDDLLCQAVNCIRPHLPCQVYNQQVETKCQGCSIRIHATYTLAFPWWL